jgi:Uma2 family endonuclease
MLTLNVAEKTYTIAEYLEMEDKEEEQHEYNNGQIVERGSKILPHTVVKLRFMTSLDFGLDKKSPHVVLNSDTKVRIEAKNRFVYPDLSISDGMPVYYDTPDGKTRRDIIINPLLIVEVLSDDTRAHDKAEKFDDYCTIPSFREYILIEPETVWVKSYHLHDPAKNLWQIEIITDKNATLALRSLQITLKLEDIYAVLEKLPASK